MDANFESRDLAHLEPGFAIKAREVIQRCSERGVEMRPFFTLRGPGVQARLYCRSRTMAKVYAKAQELQRQKALYLASLLSQVWCVDHPQRNPKEPIAWATNALPGESWHQWGRAMDCSVFHTPSGKIVWGDPKTESPEQVKWARFGYRVYAEEAVKAGLIAGANWQSVDAVHIQSPKTESPLHEGHNWASIEEQMILKFRSK